MMMVKKLMLKIPKKHEEVKAETKSETKKDKKKKKKKNKKGLADFMDDSKETERFKKDFEAKEAKEAATEPEPVAA